MATGQDRNSDPTDISQVLDSLGQMISELDACVKEVDNCDQSGSQLEDADLQLEALLADTDEFEDDEQLCLIPRSSPVQNSQPSISSQAKSQHNHHQVNSNEQKGSSGNVANAKGSCSNPTSLKMQQNLYSVPPSRAGHKGVVNEVALANETHGSFKRVETGNPNPGNPNLQRTQQNIYSVPPGRPGHKGAVNEVALANETHGSFKRVGTGNPNSGNPTPVKTQQNMYSAPPGHPGHKGAVNEVALAGEIHGSFKKVGEGSSAKAAAHTQSPTRASAVKAQPNYYVVPSELGLGSTSNGKVLGRDDHGGLNKSDKQPHAAKGNMSHHPGNHQKKTQEEGSLAQIPVKVYSEDSVPVTLIATPNMTTREACHKLILLNKVDVDPQWVLVEHLTDLGLERNLEDHEDVMSTLMTWAPGSSNKFLFRKDYSKYHFFTHTSNYFPPHLLDSELADKAVTEQAQKAKRILHQKLFSTCARVPEIEGCLHFKDFGKKSWNKKFFFLRGSGLYCSTKGKSKASKDLECYVQFEGANLYSILNPKKSHKSPTEFSFCIVPLRAKEMKELKCFCADDEKTAMSWVMAVRLAKYGPQLRHNYDDMIRKLSKLTKYREQAGKKVIHESEERTLETVQVIKEGQVAMDFTGERGKVITDSQEIKEVAVTRQKVKITRRISSQNFIPTHTVVPGCQFKNEPWYHGRITREHSLELLMAAGVVDGLFLVRESSSVTGVFVLTFCMNRKVYHCQLVQDIGHGNETFFSLGKGPGFRTLQELVCFYQTKPLNGLSLALRTPCPKQQPLASPKS